MWIACFNSNERRSLYTTEFAAQLMESNPGRVIHEAYESSDALTLVERLLDVDTQTFLPDQLLVKMDIAGMAYSLEVRSPLLDHVFMEMAARLPLSAKVSTGHRETSSEGRDPALDSRERARPAQARIYDAGRVLVA